MNLGATISFHATGVLVVQYIKKKKLIKTSLDDYYQLSSQAGSTRVHHATCNQMNSTLSSKSHVNKICNEVNSAISMLRQTAQFLPQSARMELVKGLILARYINYLDIYIHAMSKADETNLLKSSKNCIRNIYGNRNFNSPVSHLTSAILGCNSLIDFLKAHCCFRMFKLLNYQNPSYLYEMIRFPTRRRNNNPAAFPAWTDHARQDFFCAGAELWNKFDLSTRCEPSKEKFRYNCFAFFRSEVNYANHSSSLPSPNSNSRCPKIVE